MVRVPAVPCTTLHPVMHIVVPTSTYPCISAANAGFMLVPVHSQAHTTCKQLQQALTAPTQQYYRPYSSPICTSPVIEHPQQWLQLTV
jgi:hypothetical protein